MKITKQTVWYDISNAGSSGFFLWEVQEGMGDWAKWYDGMFLTKDDGWVFVMCYHFFTEESLKKFLAEPSYILNQKQVIIN